MSNSRDRAGGKSTVESASPVSARRRRLIKGFAAAAPGIFTLYSGNAQAMLSNKQCATQGQAAFTGEEELGGQSNMVDGFVRLGEGPGIHVVQTAGNSGVTPGNAGGASGDAGVALSNVDGASGDAGVALSNVAAAPGNSAMKDKWLAMITDRAGVSHYVEVGHWAGNASDSASGTSWNDSLAGVEWIPAHGRGQGRRSSFGAGNFGGPITFIDPSSDPSDPDIYIQDFTETKTIQVLACIDDSGNVVSAFPQDCDALGLAPPTGSCWSSMIGAEPTNTWWG